MNNEINATRRSETNNVTEFYGSHLLHDGVEFDKKLFDGVINRLDTVNKHILNPSVGLVICKLEIASDIQHYKKTYVKIEEIGVRTLLQM